MALLYSPSKVFMVRDKATDTIFRYLPTKLEAERWPGTANADRYTIEEREIFCVFVIIRRDFEEEPEYLLYCKTLEIAVRERQRMVDAYKAGNAWAKQSYAESLCIEIGPIVVW